MTVFSILKILPLIILAGTPLVVMLVIAFYRDHVLTATLTLLGLIFAFFSLPYAAVGGTKQITLLLQIDGYALFYMAMLILATLVIVILSYNYLRLHEGNKEEFYLLIMLATLGSSVLVASTHFASFFLGLEILSVSLYSLIAYLKTNEKSVEAGIKYLVLAAASSAFLLFGMALVYAQYGVMEFSQLAHQINLKGMTDLIPVAGFGMIIMGIGFKLAFVPFHMWTPDVYEGAPAPVSAYIASVSKGGMLALLFRLFMEFDVHEVRAIVLIFTTIAIASMFFGNFLALLQKNVKRILAYSSIAHFGYILVAFLAGTNMGVEAATFYILSYFITIIGAFAIVSVLSSEKHEAEDIEDYRGLYWKHPWVSAIFTAMLLSLAGIPLTVGFIGKYYVIAAGINSSLWALVIILVVNSAIGLYYYLRVVVVMYSHPEEGTEPEQVVHPSVSFGGGLILAILMIAVMWFGIYPTGVIGVIKMTITSLHLLPFTG